MTARAETVLPEPLSPTSPSVFPRSTVKFASSIDREPLAVGQELDTKALDREQRGRGYVGGRRIRRGRGRCRCAGGGRPVGLGGDPAQPGHAATGACRRRRRRCWSSSGRSRPRESRRPSAIRLKERTVSMMARPGKTSAHGVVKMNW